MFIIIRQSILKKKNEISQDFQRLVWSVYKLNKKKFMHDNIAIIWGGKIVEES